MQLVHFQSRAARLQITFAYWLVWAAATALSFWKCSPYSKKRVILYKQNLEALK